MIPAATTTWRLADLAAALGLECPSGGETIVTSARDLESAEPSELAALYDRRHVEVARTSRAGALLVPPDLRGEFAGRALIIASATKAAFARAVALLHPTAHPPAGVHPTAVIGAGTTLGRGVHVGPHATIGEQVTIGAGCVIGAGAVVMDQVELGCDVWIHPRAVVYPRTIIGARCVLLSGAVVGAPGFGQAKDQAGQVVRVPHLGRVVLGDDVEVGANTTIDRATFGETRIEDRARIDNLVQVGHNARIGRDALIAAQCGLSGSSRLGDGAMMGGQSGIADHVCVGDGSAVAAKSAVFGDVAAGEVVAGIPALPIARWRRIAAVQARLPELWRTLRGQVTEDKG